MLDAERRETRRNGYAICACAHVTALLYTGMSGIMLSEKIYYNTTTSSLVLVRSALRQHFQSFHIHSCNIIFVSLQPEKPQSHAAPTYTSTTSYSVFDNRHSALFIWEPSYPAYIKYQSILWWILYMVYMLYSTYGQTTNLSLKYFKFSFVPNHTIFSISMNERYWWCLQTG